MDSHQLYNSYFTLINSADAQMNRQIRIRYDGALGKDEVLAGAQVFWYVPTQATMLKYDINKLVTSNGFSRLPLKEELLEKKDAQGNTEYDENGEPKLVEPEDYEKHHRDGYVCFYKNIAGQETNDGKVILKDINDTYFWYQISNIYNTSFTNNEIICKIVKNGFTSEARFKFNFGIYGSNGTDYTLSINYVDNQSAVINTKPLKLKADFTDFNGQSLDTAFSWEWYGINSLNLPIDTTTNRPATVYGGSEVEISASNTAQPSHLYNVIKVTTSWGSITPGAETDTLTLSAVQSIPWSLGNYYVAGADRIIYNNLGTNPQYYNCAYKIYNMADNNEITNVTWEMYYYDKNGNITTPYIYQQASTYSENYQYFSTTDNETYQKVENLTEDQFNRGIYYTRIRKLVPCIIQKGPSDGVSELGYYLAPLNLYVTDETENTKIYSVAVCKNSSGKVIYALPIYIGQNQHGSSLLNRWDESLQIDHENNTILTAMVGAGYKDEQNRFHGILMGDVVAKAEDDALTITGLYGFHEGAQSFAWKVDGTGFIGKVGHGRIEFDGNKGIIKSASYMEEANSQTGGTLIDLDDGTITLKGVSKQADGTYSKGSVNSLIQLNTLSPYLIINSASGNTLMKVSDTDMYLQSNHYNGSQGMKIDLRDGLIDAYNFKLTSAGIYLNSNPNSGENYIKIGTANDYISYSKDGALKMSIETGSISASNFSLSAGSWSSGRVILSSSGISDYTPSGTTTKSYYFAVGNAGNHMTLDTSGAFDLITSRLNLTSTRMILNSHPVSQLAIVKLNDEYGALLNSREGATPEERAEIDKQLEIVLKKLEEIERQSPYYFYVCDKDNMWENGASYIIFEKIDEDGNTNIKLKFSDKLSYADGLLTVRDADIRGELSAATILVKDTSGATLFKAGGGKVEIAGWEVVGTKLSSGDKIYFSPDEGLKIGDNFSVTSDGTLTCKNGHFSGSITADGGGTIGGWQFGDSWMHCDYEYGYITFSSAGINYQNTNSNIDKTAQSWTWDDWTVMQTIGHELNARKGKGKCFLLLQAVVPGDPNADITIDYNNWTDGWVLLHFDRYGLNDGKKYYYHSQPQKATLVTDMKALDSTLYNVISTTSDLTKYFISY